MIIVDLNRFFEITQVNQKQKLMPPVMNFYITASPARVGTFEPVNALFQTTFHFHHMSDGMHTPCVTRIQLDSLTTIRLSLTILAHLLESECIHAE